MLIPQLAPSPEADAAISVPPPARFRSLRDVPTKVRWKASCAPTLVGLTAAQQAGLRYEAKAQVYLQGLLGSTYHAGPYLYFDDCGVPRTAIPDGLHFDTVGRATIFEIKSQHMPEAWWQLRCLYEPVVRELRFVNWTSCVEVVRSYDPSIGFPEKVLVFRSPQELLEAPAAAFKVLVWKP